MAVIGVGKSDLSSVTSEKEPRIQGRQEQATGEGTSSLNTDSTKSNTEKKEEKAPESFSLALSGYAAVADGQLAAGAKQVSGKGNDEQDNQGSSDGEEIVLQPDGTPVAVTEPLVVTQSITQDPLLLSRWVEFAKGNATVDAGKAAQVSDVTASGTSATQADDGEAGKARLVTSLLPKEAQAMEGDTSSSDAATGTLPLKESNQQRLQAALLSRGSSLGSAIELARVTGARAEAGSSAANAQVAAQHAGSLSQLSTSRQEQSLPTAATTTLLSSSGDTSSSAPLSASGMPMNVASGVQGHEWSPVKLSSPQSQWGQQLVDTLKERVEMQSSQNIKQAHIRLDPPDLGKLELTVRIDGDKLSVQLNASNPAVRDALVQSSERLRMNLSTQHSGGVEVNVGQGDSQRQQQDAQEETILAGRRNLMTSESDAAVAEMAGLNALV